MKLETIKKYAAFIEEMTQGNYISLRDFADQNDINYDTLNVQLSAMRKDIGEYQNLCKDAIEKYDKVQRKWKNKDVELTIPEFQEDVQLDAEHTEEIQDTDDRIESSILRNTDKKIIGYRFKVFRRDKTPVQGTLTRDEMQLIYRLYSDYGAGITQRQLSRHFPDYSLQDFKRILRAFNITKASGPFAPHMYEEKSEEELKEYHLREKENDFLKKIEKDELSDIKKTVVKLAKENSSLRNNLSVLTNVKIDLTGFTPREVVKQEPTGKTLSIYLADLHIGARCESHSLYDNVWDEKELKRRLNCLIDQISKLGYLDSLIINLMGDNLDGMDNQTARRDHIMPQNMDNREQLEVFLRVMLSFIESCRSLANNIKIVSVMEGNHDGDFGYAATIALKYAVASTFDDISMTVFDKFFGYYKIYDHTIVLTHGKDAKFMKKGLPLNLNDKTQMQIYEWLEDNNIHGSNIHIVKGDLHSNALNSCRLFDYRNVLSLFGASDYSNYNFSRNSYGVSYDLFIGDIRTIGTFENF